VDDEPQIVRGLRVVLRNAGFRVDAAGTKEEALDALSHRPPDAVLLDLVLPDGSGVDVCRQVREWSQVPIVVVSAVGDEREKVRALDAGADDYVTKPFGVGELLARVRAALRNAVRSQSGSSELRFGSAEIDLERRTASRDGEKIRLTPIEFRMLATLAKHLGMVVTHRQLLTEVWGPTHESDTHYLRIYMKQLRQKLESDPVQPRHLLTETGVGYRLVIDE
jgi:two-component system KDP operon response regulator KdpE